MTGLETSLSLVLTHLVRAGVIDYGRMIQAMAVAPREILRQEPVKIEAGSVADLTVIDPEAAWTVEVGDFYSKAKNSGFIGAELTRHRRLRRRLRHHGGRQDRRVGDCRQPMSCLEGAVFGRSLLVFPPQGCFTGKRRLGNRRGVDAGVGELLPRMRLRRLWMFPEGLA